MTAFRAAHGIVKTQLGREGDYAEGWNGARIDRDSPELWQPQKGLAKNRVVNNLDAALRALTSHARETAKLDADQPIKNAGEQHNDMFPSRSPSGRARRHDCLLMMGVDLLQPYTRLFLAGSSQTKAQVRGCSVLALSLPVGLDHSIAAIDAAPPLL